jgi:hypothetical protein
MWQWNSYRERSHRSGTVSLTNKLLWRKFGSWKCQDSIWYEGYEFSSKSEILKGRFPAFVGKSKLLLFGSSQRSITDYFIYIYIVVLKVLKYSICDSITTCCSQKRSISISTHFWSYKGISKFRSNFWSLKGINKLSSYFLASLASSMSLNRASSALFSVTASSPRKQSPCVRRISSVYAPWGSSI